MTKQFVWKHHPQKEFLSWAEQEFPELHKYRVENKPHPEIQSRLIEVHDAAMQVLDFVMKNCNLSTQRYYVQDFVNLNKAFMHRDAAEYTQYLESFLDGIRLE